VIVHGPDDTTFVLGERHEGVRPFIAIDVESDGVGHASPAFPSIADLRSWQSGHASPWGSQRRTVSGKQARRWLAAQARDDQTRSEGTR
jgi:hypothetical protein